MLKKIIQRSLLFLSIFVLAFLITGCSLQKDMEGPNENKSSVSSEQHVTESDEEGEEVDDEPGSSEEEDVKTDTSSPNKEEKKKESANSHSASNEQKTSKDSQKKSTSSTENKNVNKKQHSSQAKKTSSTKSDKSSGKKQTETQKKKNTVVYSIVISSNEVPLRPTKVEITDGDTVLDALIKVTKEKKIQMDYRGGRGGTAYVEGIANVYEFDRGQGSGWMFRVNGIFPDRGAGVVPLYAGDRVEWLYTTNLGKDLGANLQPFRR